MSRFISQVVVTGDNRPYNIALVVPDWVAIRSELGLSELDTSEEELVNNSAVKGLLSAEIKLNCYNIKKFEVPVAFLVVAPFTAANNMVTPKVSAQLSNTHWMIKHIMNKDLTACSLNKRSHSIDVDSPSCCH